jgi:glycosyltransferase A (GT-A) superfamily protein (DUF2064 family)
MSLITSDPLAPTRGRALVVMVRLPRTGRCKTRLSPPLSSEDAAGLYRAFLCDIGRLLSEWGDDCDLFVAWANDPGPMESLATQELLPDDEGLETFTDHSPPVELQAIFAPGTRFLRQLGEGLSERMEGIFDRLFAAGYRQVVMRNSDSPHLPTSILDDAFARLDESPAGSVVLGPDLDGGFYLVGLDGPPAGLFPRIMSTKSVLDQTVASAGEMGRDVHQLEPFLDIDSADDLRLFWLEFGGRADVRDWATWRRIAGADIMEILE